MLDPSLFGKLEKDMQNVLMGSAKKTVKALEDAFARLPKKLQDALEHEGFAELLGATKDLGKKVKSTAGEMKKLQKMATFLEDQADSVNDVMDKLRKKRIKDNKTGRDLINKASTPADKAAAQALLKSVQSQYKKIFDNLRRVLKGIDASKDALSLKQELTKRLHMKERARKQGDNDFTKAFGLSRGDAIDKAKTMWHTVTSLNGLFGKLALAVAMVVKNLLDAYRAFRAAGYGGYQAVGSMFTSTQNRDSVFGTWFNLFRHGVLTGLGRSASAMGAVSNNLGTTETGGRETVRETATLDKLYNVPVEQAGRFASNLLRASKFQDSVAANAIKTARAFAEVNKFPKGTMMRDMAANTEIMAMYADRGLQSFTKSILVSRQFGTNIQSASNFADRMVDDFESSLDMQARIQTILPGADFSEVMYASQFGTEDQVVQALHDTLNSIGYTKLDQLPRSLRNMITRQLGFAPDQLQNIMSGRPPGAGEVKGADKDYRETVQNVVTSLLDFVAANTKATLALVGFTMALGPATFRALRGGVGGIGSTLGGLGGLSSGARLALGVGGAGVFSGLLETIQGKHEGLSTGKSLLRGLLGGGSTAAFGLVGSLLGSAFPVVGTAAGGIIGSMIGGLFGHTIASSVHHGGGMAGRGPQRNVPAVIYQAASRFHGGLMPDEVPAILKRGEAVLTPTMLRTMASVVGATQELGNARLAGAVTGRSAMAQGEAAADGQSNPRIEQLLLQLIAVTRGQKNIYVDGRKIGQALMESHRDG